MKQTNKQNPDTRKTERENKTRTKDQSENKKNKKTKNNAFFSLFFCQGHVDTCLPCRPRGAHYQAEKQVSGGNLLARTALKTPALMQSHVKECIYFRIYEHDTSLHASSRARGDDIVLNTIMSALFLCLFFPSCF